MNVAGENSSAGEERCGTPKNRRTGYDGPTTDLLAVVNRASLLHVYVRVEASNNRRKYSRVEVMKVNDIPFP